MRFLKFRISQRYQKPLCENHISIFTSLLWMAFQHSLWSVFKKVHNSKGVNNPREINYRSIYKVAQMFKYFMDHRFILLYKHRKTRLFRNQNGFKGIFYLLHQNLICYSSKVCEIPYWCERSLSCNLTISKECDIGFMKDQQKWQPQGFFTIFNIYF